MRYIGFGGNGNQVRDAFHPEDLADLICLLLRREPTPEPIYNAGGGSENAMSLAQLTAWCNDRFGGHELEPDTRPRPFDIPWLIMNSSRVSSVFGWKPKRTLESILEEIATHVRNNPDKLSRSAAIRIRRLPIRTVHR